MSNIYITSDLHLGHLRSFLFKPRGFQTIEEHDAAIIENINSVVAEDDVLYILGDLMLNDNESGMKWLKQIKCGNVIVLAGNHETANRQDLYLTLPNFSLRGYAAPLKYKKWNFMLSHYPMKCDNYDDDEKPYLKVWNLCGHSHTKQIFDSITGSYHCELDAHNNFPVSIDTIISDIKAHCAQRQPGQEAIPYVCAERAPISLDGICPKCGKPITTSTIKIKKMEYEYHNGYSYRFNGNFLCESCGAQLQEYQANWGRLN